MILFLQFNHGKYEASKNPLQLCNDSCKVFNIFGAEQLFKIGNCTILICTII